MTTNVYATLMAKKQAEELTEEELACALYEGTAHLANLAEKLARQHGQAQALSYYDLMGEGVQAFWRSIARELIEHSRHWLPNQGSACILDEPERERLCFLAETIIERGHEGPPIPGGQDGDQHQEPPQEAPGE
jgi:hypothetical protein